MKKKKKLYFSVIIIIHFPFQLFKACQMLQGKPSSCLNYSDSKLGIQMQKLLPHSEGTLAKRIPPFKENDGFFSQSHFKCYLSLTRLGKLHGEIFHIFLQPCWLECGNLKP